VTPLIGRVGLASRAPETTSVVYRCFPKSRHLGKPAERTGSGCRIINVSEKVESDSNIFVNPIQ
jgi:hypothetical protein